MVTRFIVFIILIILGFIVAKQNKKVLTIVVTVIYAAALFYYTFFSRIEIVPVSVAATNYGAVSTVRTWKTVLLEIFQMRTYDKLPAFALNILLFVPMGYLVPSFFRNLKWWQVVLIGSFGSLSIEVLQKITGYGMFDLRDILANTIGTAVGVLMAIPFFMNEVRRSER